MKVKQATGSMCYCYLSFECSWATIGWYVGATTGVDTDDAAATVAATTAAAAAAAAAA